MNTILQKRIDTRAAGIGLEFRDAIASRGSNRDVAEAVATLTQTAAHWMAEWLLEHMWISVEEALPPKEEEDDDTSITVLVRCRKGWKGIDYYRFKYEEWCNNRNDVTHWMMIPTINKEEK